MCNKARPGSKRSIDQPEVLDTWMTREVLKGNIVLFLTNFRPERFTAQKSNCSKLFSIRKLGFTLLVIK